MDWRTKLIHPQTTATDRFQSLATATYRGSTVIFNSQEAVVDNWRTAHTGYTYGLYGTPTTRELAARIADLEGAHHTFIVPSGQAAILLVYLAFCKTGSHVLVPSNAYGPNKNLAEGVLQRFGLIAEHYDPMIGPGVADLICPETSLIWCESPGSITMEVQDIPAIVAAAHARNVPVAFDNTYAAGVLLDAFSLGVDISLQALTKYIGGHSDILLGSVSASNEATFERLGSTLKQLGMGVSPDDCSLALRGLQTLSVRLEALERSTMAIATWIKDRPEVEVLLHPAFPSCPGHEFWKRDFTGSASIFSIVLDSRYTAAQVNSFVDELKLFKIGYSWGGVASLVMAYPELNHEPSNATSSSNYAGRIVRFNIGLENTQDLIEDLTSAFAVLQA
jgi:cystathionine beta-lyase